MANFDSGVKDYLETRVTVKQFFPIDFQGIVQVNCYLCKLFNRQSGRCNITDEISEFPKDKVGSHCPLKVVEKKRSKGEE